MKTLVLFASGTGSNVEAIAQAVTEGRLNAKLGGLVCDKPGAPVIAKAKALGMDVVEIMRNDFPNAIVMDEAILNQCRLWKADWLILAGYMRVIHEPLLSAYPRRILNIHPSLLPKYRGLDALGQALAAGETTVGVSVHYVDAGLDTGEVIAQIPFTIEPNTPRAEIEKTLHDIEHRLYPAVIQQLVEDPE
jgi:phosphoribosylglycinamide formyltransferase-1